jgi:hypothetical protein
LLARAENNGSGSIAINDVAKERLNLVINGSGDITAKGRVTQLGATINGSGDVHAADLKSERAAITVNGSGDAYVYATGVLSAKVCGSGHITYTGSPAEVQKSVTGSGGIIKE